MKVQNPLIGRSSGKFSNSIFSKWKKSNVVRSKPLEVANPRTLAQQTQRSKFAFLLVVAKSLSSIIRAGYKEVATTMTEFNKFMSTNLTNEAIGGSYPNWTLEASSLEIAKGSLDTTPIESVNANGTSGSVSISYEVDPVGNQSPGDKAFVVISVNDNIALIEAEKVRGDGSTSITIADTFVAGDNLDIWLFFTSPDGRKVSDSVYMRATAV